MALDVDALNAPQREAVLHEGGPLVVFAGAGSGKTRVITYRIAHLVAERGVPPWRILAVTFTNKAAAEMRERLGKLLPDGAGREVWAATFHSTCARLLRKYHELAGIRRDFVIYDDADQRAVLARVIKDLKLDDKRYDPKRIAHVIDRAKQEALLPPEMKVHDAFAEVAQRVWTEYEERLRASGALDFGDLVLRVVRASQDVPELRDQLSTRFQHVLVDEFQDTNRVQMLFVRLLAEVHRNLVVVGDDDQSIYRWRGADRRNILDFRATFADAVIVKLEQNYRSTKRILRAANAVISRAVDREPKTLWTDNDDGNRVLAVQCADERDEARLVAETAKEMLRSGQALAEMSVFYRIHAQSRVLEEALRAAQITYRIVGGTRFYDRAEVKDVLAYLRIVTNPDDDVSLLRIINVPPRGIGKTTIDRLLEVATIHKSSVWGALDHAPSSPELPRAAVKKLGEFLSFLTSLRARTEGGEGPHSIAEAVLEATGYKKVLQDEDTAEADARLENLNELLGAMQEFENEAETPTLSEYLATVTLATDTDRDKTSDAVTLMTVHAAKGLEFPVVIVTGLEERMFPYRGVEPGDDPEELEEERRLAYVAFTRAREKLVLTWAPMRRVFGQARFGVRSRFVDEVPRDDVQAIATNAPREQPYVSRGHDAPARSAPWRHPQHTTTASGETRSPKMIGESYVDRSEGDIGEDAMFRRGMTVSHAKYGLGEVRAVEDGVPVKVTVTFPGWGTKQIVARFLQPAKQ